MGILGLDFSDDNVLLATIGAGLALVAAVAGVVGVLQNRRAWRAAHFPDLRLDTGMRDIPGKVTVTVVNNGGGAATGTTFLVAIADARFEGKLRVMESGRRFVLETREEVSNSEPYAGMVSCFQPDGSVQTYFHSAGRSEKRVYRKRPWRRELPSDKEMFAEEFPEIRLDELRKVSFSYPQLTQP